MELFSLPALFLLLAAVITALLLFYSGGNPPSKVKTSDASGSLKPYPIIGHLPQYLRNRRRFLDWQTGLLAASPTNTITFRRLGNVRGVFTANPANVEHMLKSNFDNYPKGHRFISTMEDFFGRGIFNSDGDLWKVQRKTSSFEFNTRSLRNFVVENVRREVTARLLPLLSRAAAGGAVVDLQDVLERFAFDNVCKVAFNEDPACLADDAAAALGEGGEESDGVGKLSSGFTLAFEDAVNISVGRFRYAIPGMWKLEKLLNIGSEKRLKESISTVHGFATRIIRSRKKERESSPDTDLASHRQDLLSRFVAGEDNSDEFVRDIVISFILAGRDTTSSALSWFFWLLSSSPEVEHKILEELRSIRERRAAAAAAADEGEEETFGFEELRQMHYLHAAISESMRLYPPVPANRMTCLADDVLPDGTFVGKGWFMSYNAYAMGRMPAVWGDDCWEYKPERWLDEGGAFRPESSFRFPAFHGGPRMCLGREMAYIQMKSIAAAVLEGFVVEVAEEGRRPEQMLSLTLRMKGGLPVRLRVRTGAKT